MLVSSDLARKLAAEIGLAASQGYITTHTGITTHNGPLFGRQWLITQKGLKWLEENT